MVFSPLSSFCIRKITRKTGRCHGCALKFGIGLMQELVDTNIGNDSEKLLSLSVVIAIKALTSDMSSEDRRSFAADFKNIAFQIEAEPYVGMSLLDMLLRRKPPVIAPVKGSEN